jgi:flagellin
MKMIKIIIPCLIIAVCATLTAKENSFLFQPEGSNFYVYGYGTKSFIINQSKITGMNIDKQLSQLSTARRINSAADDPSGYAVAEKMKGLLNQLRQESMNAEDMRNLHNFIESAIGQDQEILQRIRQLTVQASNGILNSEDRENIQSEINELLNQLDMNAKFLQFNTISVIPELSAEYLGLDKLDAVHNPEKSIGLADEAMAKLTRKRIIQGVHSNILKFQIDGKSYQFLNLQKAESNISDLDMAEGISGLIKNSVLLKTEYGLIIRSK